MMLILRSELAFDRVRVVSNLKEVERTTDNSQGSERCIRQRALVANARRSTPRQNQGMLQTKNKPHPAS